MKGFSIDLNFLTRMKYTDRLKFDSLKLEEYLTIPFNNLRQVVIFCNILDLEYKDRVCKNGRGEGKK